MAQIPYAAGARIIELSLTPSVPGQIQHEIPFTGETKILNRGYGLWAGVARFGVLKGSAAAQCEAMFAALNGSENYIELPLRGRATIDAATSITAVNGSTYTLAASRLGLVRGSYVRSGDRVFVITAQPSARVVQLWPLVPLKVGDVIKSAATIRARSSGGNVPELPSTPHWSGPWVFGFREAL